MSSPLIAKYTSLPIHQKFLSLSARERKLAWAAALIVMLFGGWALLIEPLLVNISKSERDIRRLESQLTTANLQLQTFEQELKDDPDDKLKAQLKQINDRISAVDDVFAREIQDLVPARQMPALLDKVLSEANALTLVEMHSIAPVDVLKATADPEQQETEASDTTASLYQHGVKLVLEGSYFDIQSYLQALEELPWRFYWRHFDYKVVEYPTAQVQIELFTLSTSEAFIGV